MLHLLLRLHVGSPVHTTLQAVSTVLQEDESGDEEEIDDLDALADKLGTSKRSYCGCLLACFCCLLTLEAMDEVPALHT